MVRMKLHVWQERGKWQKRWAYWGGIVVLLQVKERRRCVVSWDMQSFWKVYMLRYITYYLPSRKDCISTRQTKSLSTLLFSLTTFLYVTNLHFISFFKMESNLHKFYLFLLFFYLPIPIITKCFFSFPLLLRIALFFQGDRH